MIMRPIAEDVVSWRMLTLAANGVRPELQREVAVQQLETERAQAISQRDMSQGREDDGAMMQRAKFDGVDPKISAMFEHDQFELHRSDKHSGSKSKSRKRTQSRSYLQRFPEYEAS